MSPCMIHENAPHQLGCDTKKMRPILPTDILLINELQICFIDQRRGLKRMTWAFLAHIACCQTMQFLINKRDQFA